MRYLIVSHIGLGNMILKTPMFAALHSLDPQAEIDVMANNHNGALDILERNPHVRQTLPYQTRCSLQSKREVARHIREQNYDVALMPMDAGPGWLQLAIYRTNIKTKIALWAVPGLKFRDRAMLFLLHRRIHFVPWLVGRHEIDLNLDLVQALTRKPLERSYQTKVSYQPDDSVRQRFGLPARYVCLQIGAAAGLRTPKRWPSERFSQLIESLGELCPGLGLVALGTPKESEMYIAPLMAKHPQLINTAGRTDLNSLCNILHNAEAVVAHDSGIMHLANALDLNLVALYGPTDYTRTLPLGRRTLVLRKELPCSPCMFGFDGPEESDVFANCPGKDCLRAIEAAEVIAALRKQAPGIFPA